MPNGNDRGLSTARAVLCVLSYIAESQRGVSAREVADRLQKSLSTAYHLLASLEAEGFIVRLGRAGYYQLVPGNPAVPPSAPPAPVTLTPDEEQILEDGMRRVFAVTGRRTCIGVFADRGINLVQDIGRQGLPRMGNLEKPLIRASAHALAVGKVLLAALDETELGEWVAEHGLRPFTTSTIVDLVALRCELGNVRRRGIATDRGEYDPDFGSVAIPFANAAGRSVAAIAVTVTRHQFDAERDELQRALIGVTRGLREAEAV